MDRNILICGVGGQGTVLSSKLIASAFMADGEVVHSAETIGMAQRGGSVTSHIRVGRAVFSPLIPEGRGDLMLSFEPAEAVRNLNYLKADGIVIVNSHPVKPITESLKETGYDGSEMTAYLQQHYLQTYVVDSHEICRPFGSVKFFNIIMLGIACGLGALGVAQSLVVAEIEKKVKEKFVEVNKQAFAAGVKLGENYATN
ncbi:MAG: indolepyruvate oxidoreductase subunit beta [Succinivibrio sp.]|nr:indolepyruvate oxidoreductase subunit beta [Succinivibrio sp.]